MTTGIALLIISSLSLSVCIISIVRVSQRIKRYSLPENNTARMFGFLSLRHFVVIYLGLIVFWLIAGFTIGILLITR